MYKTLGRFIKRGRDGEDDNGAILILAKDGQKIFKQDTIYEIKEVMGEMIIREVGITHMDPKKWGQEIQYIALAERPLLTKEELERIEEKYDRS